MQEVSRKLNGLPAVKVTRPGPWGNPFYVDRDHCKDNAEAVMKFIAHLKTPTGKLLAKRARKELAGKNLACFCRPGQPCHADVLIAVANT